MVTMEIKVVDELEKDPIHRPSIMRAILEELKNNNILFTIRSKNNEPKFSETVYCIGIEESQDNMNNFQKLINYEMVISLINNGYHLKYTGEENGYVVLNPTEGFNVIS